MALFHSIEESRVQPDFDWGGNSASVPVPKGNRELKRLDCSLKGCQTEECKVEVEGGADMVDNEAKNHRMERERAECPQEKIAG